MGIKHLQKIEKIMKESPELSFLQSDFTNYYKIDYYTAGDCLQYLWKHKMVSSPVNGRYRWKNELD